MSGYYAYKSRCASKRSIADKRLADKIKVIHEANYSCYGVRKVWHALLNNNKDVARCTVERLMRVLQIKGAVRGKVKRTTIAAKDKTYTPDLVNRKFSAVAPNKLWVADFTYGSTWQGWCYTAFVTDVFARRIIGYSVATRMTKQMVSDAFSMALYRRAQEGFDGFEDLIHHNDYAEKITKPQNAIAPYNLLDSAA